MQTLTITEYVPVPNIQPFPLNRKLRSPKRQQADYAVRDRMTRNLKAVIRPGTQLRYETLEVIGAALARHNHGAQDSQNPGIIANWMVDYLLHYIVEVEGVYELGLYIGDVEEARRLGMPHANALIASTYPELAPYCGAQKAVGIAEAKAFCIG